MVTRAALAVVLLVVTLTLVRCAADRGERSRALPSDRSAPIVYVALGDSTVEGIAATSPERTYVHRLYERLRDVYVNARVVNLGRSGAVSADVVGQQLPRAVALAPHLVTLSVGPNDLTAGVSVATYESNLDEIFRRLTRETTALVVVNLLPDLAVTPRFRASEKRALVGPLTARFNEAVERQARQHGIEVVDLYRASQDEVPRRPELIAADGYHPSDLGYARWAELMWSRVESRIAAR